MRMRTMMGLILGVWMAAGLTGRAETAAADERGLWMAWVSHTNGGDHAAIVAACRQFTTRTNANADPLLVVAKGIEAWHLLKMGETNAAIQLLDPMIPVGEGATPLQKAASEMAKVWMTRLDREMIRIALRKIYVRDIEFPASLEAIKKLKIKRMPPFTDRWGKPWIYATGSKIKGMEKQQYTLEAAGLGEKSDLGKALAVTYGMGLSLEPVRQSPVSPDMFEFTSPFRKSLMIQSGSDMEGVTFAYLGANIIILADKNYWRIAVKPR